MEESFMENWIAGFLKEPFARCQPVGCEIFDIWRIFHLVRPWFKGMFSCMRPPDGIILHRGLPSNKPVEDVILREPSFHPPGHPFSFALS